MMNLENDHFGVTEAQVNFAISDQNGVFRDGLYVPSRKDVKTMPIDALTPIIIGWLWESPSALIPSNEQVKELRSELLLRERDTTELIRECDDFLNS